ncbi:YqaA family protein [Xylanibacter muris]|uniref:DedA family protein n=1 Tax=Xylanibacter muris TaxID=2736290 RepID=A0ABX2APK5_9BACT|nr:YqaA family protein [Xylanibacter muris]NPD92144.1 DedA family protein [Xylanibacter muris]
MDTFIELLIEYGYGGMLIAAFLAGSAFPFSSEAVMVGLRAAGLEPWGLIVYGTIGNVAGGMLNYYIGRMGKLEWIEKYLKVKKEKLDRAVRFMSGKGAWMGLLSVLPIIGTAVTVALGLMRTNVFITFTSVTIGKFTRYLLLMYGTDYIIGMF